MLTQVKQVGTEIRNALVAWKVIHVDHSIVARASIDDDVDADEIQFEEILHRPSDRADQLLVDVDRNGLGRREKNVIGLSTGHLTGMKRDGRLVGVRVQIAYGVPLHDVIVRLTD